MKLSVRLRNGRTLVAVLAAALAGFSSPARGQFSLGADVYLGLNMAYALDANFPSITIEDDFDQAYDDLNLASPARVFLHGHLRINAVHVWNFSLGYMLWGHHQQYSENTQNDLVKLGPVYPHSVDYTLHAATIQWNMKIRGFYSRSILPFLYFGAGPSYGSSKNYWWESPDDTAMSLKKIVALADEYKSWGYCAGIGAILFRRTFFSIGLVSFEDNDAPMRRMIEAGIGIKI
jgi:hypothetical protein